MENYTDAVVNEIADEIDLKELMATYAFLGKEIDIISDAPRRFLEIVDKIEQTHDVNEKAKIALDYIMVNNAISEISYLELISRLTNPSSSGSSFWRQMYLLERSIPRRKTDTPTESSLSWVARLKTFADTYTLEYAINKQQLDALPGLIRFTKKSGNHDILHSGHGTAAPDFYCWDPKIKKNHGFVEFKHWGSSNINTAKDYYADKRYIARYVLVFLASHEYKLIDYLTDTIIDQPNLPVPENLLIW